MTISFWKIAQFYDECLQVGTSPKQSDTNLGVTYKHDVLLFTVDMLFSLISFFHNADFLII